MADKAAATAAAPTPEGQSAGGWTQDKVTAEVQSALREVLGRSLEPEEPFMSGQCAAVAVAWMQMRFTLSGSNVPPMCHVAVCASSLWLPARTVLRSAYRHCSWTNKAGSGFRF
jgi:hypothetical protein